MASVVFVRSGPFVFRPLKKEDQAAIRALHEAWFPVIYPDEFYQQVTAPGGSLFALGAVHPDRGIVGVIVARFARFADCDEEVSN